MSSINFSELATIAVIVLVIFGPKRLPELARKAGRFAAKARAMIRDAEAELKAEYRDTIQPVQEARQAFTAAAQEVQGTARRAEKDLNAAARDVETAANDAVQGVNKAVSDQVTPLAGAAPSLSRSPNPEVEGNGGTGGGSEAAESSPDTEREVS